MDLAQRVSIGQHQLPMTRAGFGCAPIGNFPVSVSSQAARAALRPRGAPGSGTSTPRRGTASAYPSVASAPSYGTNPGKNSLFRPRSAASFAPGRRHSTSGATAGRPSTPRTSRPGSTTPTAAWCGRGRTACSGSGWHASTCCSSTTLIASTSRMAPTTTHTSLSS